MKKIPIFLIILAPIFVLMVAAVVFFGIQLSNTNIAHDEKTQMAESIESIEPAKEIVSYNIRKTQPEYEHKETDNDIDNEIKAIYVYENITFTSYSEAWDEENLAKLCDELLANTHGSEIDYLEEVLVYGEEDPDALGTQESNYEPIKIPISLLGMTSEDFAFDMPNTASVLTLHNGNEYTTVEQMAITLSHEYGHHFTLYYFNLTGDDSEIKNDPYFKLRYVEDDDFDILYEDKDFDDRDEYFENHMWYLIEIAADDYVYLMGSPNTRRTYEYYDTLDQLRMDVKGKDDEVEAYYDLLNEYYFNESPHENVALPLPDEVDGLPELFYDAINLEAPQYEDRTKEAEEIELKILRHKNDYVDKTYYTIAWNKPWESDDVTYTLVAYDENDKLIGAIKSIDGKGNSKAYIGAVVYTTSNYYHYYNSDYWVKQDFLRFRVIVTFSDGTAVVSPPAERDF